MELELRDHTSAEHLDTVDAVWVRGGNTFVLREALERYEADIALSRAIVDGLVYAGYSVGADVLAPDLHGVELVDDVTAVARPRWNGLGVLDRPFVPHVRSPAHPKTLDCDRLSAAYALDGTKHWALSDGDVLFIDGDTAAVPPAEPPGL